MKTFNLSNIQIAIVCHAVNLAYCAFLGDDSQKPWDEADDWQKESAEKGVAFLVENPEAGPDAIHANWMADKLADGWVFGEEKDADKKTHPSLVEFDELPEDQRLKDHLFSAVVRSMLPLVVEVEEPEVTEQSGGEEPKKEPPVTVKTESAPTVIPKGFTPIVYVGVRERYVDALYNTRIEFEKGKVALVPSDKARLMLNHPDQYQLAEIKEVTPEQVQDAEKVQTEVKSQEDQKDETQEQLQAAKDALLQMDVAALRAYAEQNFAGHKINKNFGVEKARQAVINLIDQFGISK